MNTIIRYPERSSAWNLVNDFDNLFDGFVRPNSGDWKESNTALTPAVDVVEKDDCYQIVAELPGVNRDDLDVSFKDGVLTINAETKYETEGKNDDRVIRRERRYGKYVRSLRFGSDVDHDKVDAKYTDGVLTISLPKAEKVLPRRIEIKAS